MIISIQELTDFPASPNDGDQFFHSVNDAAYVYAPGNADATYGPLGGWLQISTGAALREDQRLIDTINRTQYSGRDYGTFVDEISTNVKATFSAVYNDFLTSAPGQMLIKYISSALDTLSFNLDSRATEACIAIAALRSSIAREARSRGYKPGRSVAAGLDLKLTLTSGPYAFNIPVPAGFQFNGPEGKTFEQVSDVVILAGQVDSTVVAPDGVGYAQWETKIEKFTSNGQANQTFKLRQATTTKFVAMDSVTVYVGSTQWTEYEFLPFDQVNGFEVLYDYDPPILRFGDSIVGNIPGLGADIRVEYKVTRGRDGNSVAANSVKSPKSSLTVNFQDIPITASHTGTSSGGENPEEARSVQVNAPAVYSTADRAVSPPDWDALLNTFSDPSAGAVARGRALIIRSIENEATIQNHLSLIKAAGHASVALNGIKSNDIAIRTQTTSIKTQKTTIDTDNSDIAAEVLVLDGYLDDALSNMSIADTELDTLKTNLKSLSYQQNIGLTDGSNVTFAATLSKVPVVPGTVSVFVEPLTAKLTTTASADHNDGTLVVTSATLDQTFVGCMVKIRGYFRRVRSVTSTTGCQYSGPPIDVKSSDVVVFYDKAIQGFDDSAGGFSGSGIDAASNITYLTGAISITFSTIPAGSDLFGQPIICSFQYEDSALGAEVDDVKGYLSDADIEIGSAKTSVTSIQTLLSTLTVDTGVLDTQADAISTLSTSNDTYVATAEEVGTNVENEVDDLEVYLDEVISGDCKANIVQLHVLAHDSGGGYTSPSNLLLQKTKEFFDARKVITVTVSPIDGVRDLVAANIDIKLEIAVPFLYSSVQPVVDIAVDGILKYRYYGAALLESDLYSLIVPKRDGTGGIKGVKSATIRITGSSYVDPTIIDPTIDPTSDGDLVVAPGQAIVRGVISYSEIVRATT